MSKKKRADETSAEADLSSAELSAAAAAAEKMGLAAQQQPYALKSEAVETKLLTGEDRHLLEAYFGEEQYRELRDLARQAAARSVRGGARVLILPGIMGSTLGFAGAWWNDTIWIDPVDIRRGRLEWLAMDHAKADGITPLGVLLHSYLKLKLRLRIAGFHADFYPYDWRRSLGELGRRLKQRIDDETSSDASFGSHVHLVAHSMGGLVARAALAQMESGLSGEALDKARAKVRRLVMLGTPNYGSFAPVMAMRGQYETVDKLAWLDKKHTAEELAKKVFRTFPGLLEMLPFRGKFSGVDLYRTSSWPDSRPRPRQVDLDEVGPVQQALHAGDDRFALIAGVEQETVTDLRLVDGEFQYLMSAAGDGTVPLDFARLPNVATYYLREGHGRLANNREAIRATIDLLGQGASAALPKEWSLARGEPWQWQAAPPRRLLPPTAEPSPRDVRLLVEEFAAPMRPSPVAAPPVEAQIDTVDLSGQPIIIGRRRQHRVDVFLARGDVTQVGSRAVVLGLFNDVDPSGAARAFDRRLDFAITDFTQRRMFSGNAGEVFVMPAAREQVRAELLVFVGLGAFDSFSNDVLSMVAENAARTLVRTGINDFATVLLGGSSVSGIREALASLVEGFLAGIRDADQDHRMRSITICEYNPQRYQLIQTELMRLATTPLMDEVEITVESYGLPEAPPAAPSLRETPAYEEPCYLFVRRQTAVFHDPRSEVDETDTDEVPPPPLVLQASVLTPTAAKATVVTDGQAIDEAELQKMLDEIGKSSFEVGAGPDSFGHRLATLLLPESVRRVLNTAREHRLVVIHDALASKVPWETLCLEVPAEQGGAERYWLPAAERGLFRKYAAENLSVAKWLESRRQARTLRLLLVVDPTLDLPGAQEEGRRVKELFASHPLVEIVELQGTDATWDRLERELKSGRYDVLHYAGHAYFDPDERSRSGLVCNGNRVLSGADLAGIGDLPSLAFFNACEAGRVRQSRRESTASDRKQARERIEANVSLAEAFLRGGIANYVGTYWPVGDLAATEFADKFYQGLIAGKPIAEAMQDGRREVQQLGSLDWADYVLYGSPQFRIKRV